MSDEHDPHHDHASERMLLGALMLNPAAIDALDLTGSYFHRPAHGAIFEGIRAAHEAGEPTEPVALSVRLGRGKPLTGSASADLAEIYGQAGAVGDIAWYAERLASLALTRGVVVGAAQIGHAARDGASIEQLHAMAEDLVHAARPPSREDPTMVALPEFVGKGLADIENRSQHQAALPTGFYDLDRLLGGGMRPGQLIVIGGRPGMGKSVLGLDIARQAAIARKRPAAYFSLEMTRQEMFDRLLAAESTLPYDRIRRGALDDRDWATANNATASMGESPLYLCDDFSLTIAKLRNKARKAESLAGGLDLVVVDYLQLVKASGRHDTREQAVSEVTRACKELAGELGCPVIAVAQLNRNSTGRTDKLPMMSDLRESGELEQAADIVILIHRDEYYDQETARAGEADLIVEKNRNGPKDTITVAAQLHHARFTNMEAA